MEHIMSEKGSAMDYRIQIIGDSWAQFIWQLPNAYTEEMLWTYIITHSWKDVSEMTSNSPFKTALEKAGLSANLVDGNNTAVGGTTTAYWAGDDKLKLVQDKLEKNSNVNVVHLSLGGNDFLFKTLALKPDLNIDKIASEAISNLKKIIDNILAVRSDIQILHVGYTRIRLCLLTLEYIQRQQLDCTDSSIRTYDDMLYTYINKLKDFSNSYNQNIRFLDIFDMLKGNPPPASDFVDKHFHLSFDNYTDLAGKCINEYYKNWLK